MKNIQINNTSIGQQDYTFVEKTSEGININNKGLTYYKAIDLGLPSGISWADRNIGASSPEDPGLYFQWGDTQGYTAEQVGVDKQFDDDFSDYKWYSDGVITKYNTVDNKLTLDLEDDAAHVNMGGNWRMPTYEEYKELCLNTDIYLVPTKGEEIQGTAQEKDGYVIINWTSLVRGTLKGVKFYKKGDKQTYMFVPASGYASDGSVRHVGAHGHFWSSSSDSPDGQGAEEFYFYWDSVGINGNFRFSGFPVRGVLAQ